VRRAYLYGFHFHTTISNKPRKKYSLRLRRQHWTNNKKLWFNLGLLLTKVLTKSSNLTWITLFKNNESLSGYRNKNDHISVANSPLSFPSEHSAPCWIFRF
jgi:hypothetical protein